MLNRRTIHARSCHHPTTDTVGRFDFDVPTLTLGSRQSENYTGLIDDVRIYNRCLSADEVRRLTEEVPR